MKGLVNFFKKNNLSISPPIEDPKIDSQTVSILKSTEETKKNGVIVDFPPFDSSEGSFADCYHSLRRSYSSENCSTPRPRLGHIPNNSISILPASDASSLDPLVSRRKSNSSIKFFKNMFKKSCDSIDSESSDSIKKSTSADSLSSCVSSKIDEIGGIVSENNFADIDESTALNTLYNLFNDLVDLNQLNRKKAENLVVRFNFLQESFRELEEKLDSGRPIYAYSKSRDKSDENTLKENTDGLSLMFFDEKMNDLASSINDIKLACDPPLGIFDLEPRFKNSSHSLSPNNTELPKFSNIVEPSIKSSVSLPSNTVSNIPSTFRESDDHYGSCSSRDSYSYLNDKHNENLPKKSNFSISNPLPAPANAPLLPATLPKYILLNKNKSFPSDKLDDASSLASIKNDPNSYVYELVQNNSYPLVSSSNVVSTSPILE
ncbi:hypothetical protein AYI68_g1452 [Smittium mucronatum]|uniref:Uncharacterized protein n=1 Tax=Smittium mucronatum TaxID=133383 RepID=A0A1R0H5M8_9FUNG|nr:hypothetical protein AYI68_g1452 [Smittium mucronatum]